MTRVRNFRMDAGEFYNRQLAHRINSAVGQLNANSAVFGDVTIAGNLLLTNTVWDDLRFPAQGINPPGAVSDPDVETTTGLLLFASNATEIIAGVAQLPHTYKEGTDVKPHVHWQRTTSASGGVYWQLDYEVVNNGDIATMAYGSSLGASTVATGTPDDNTAERVLITPLGTLGMTGAKVSSLILWKLSRIHDNAADTYGADARLIEFDIHFEINTLGSDSEFTK